MLVTLDGIVNEVSKLLLNADCPIVVILFGITNKVMSLLLNAEVPTPIIKLPSVWYFGITTVLSVVFV